MPQFISDEERQAQPPQHSESELAVLRCKHEVLIHRSRWPPQGDPRPNEPEGPHVDVPCEKCGATARYDAITAS
jgi:hypothetical protein